jgi:YVTN family beta-propeller protein
MHRWNALFAIALILVLIWLGGSAVAQGSQAAQPFAVVEPHTSTAITSTVYLPFIAKPAPTIPYVLTKIKLPTGSHPHGIALDLAGQRAFVGNHGTNSLSVINTVAMIVSATISLPSATGPNGVAYHAGLDRVYVANRNSNNLSIVDPTNRVWIANRAVGNSPDGVAVAGDLIYVANFGSNSVSILNAQTNLVSSTLPIGVEPAMFTQLEDSDAVFLSSHGNGTVYFLQNGAYLNSTFGITAPYGVAIDQITHRLYVANRGEARTTTLLDVDPNWIKGTLNVGQEPYVIGVNSRTGHVFVSLGDRVNVYDRRDNALIISLPVGTGAEEGLVVDPERGLIYVTSRDTDEVTVIQDIPTYDIAFVTFARIQFGRYPEADVRLMDDSGQHTLTLRRGTYRDYSSGLTWRPDGKRLAYARGGGGGPEDIYTVDPNGDNNVNLTNSINESDSNPAWSPDGSKIAWTRSGAWVMNADGSNKVQLTSGSGLKPLWSPDGQWISVVGYDGIFIIPANGGTLLNLTNDPGNDDMQGNWSPSSDEIVFETSRHKILSGTSVITFNFELYKVNIHSLVQTRLTDNLSEDNDPAWSPDGTYIAFLSDREVGGGNRGLYVMNSDGSNTRRLTGPMWMLGPISWSPDSRRLAVQGRSDGSAEIYVIDVVTGDIKRLTNDTVSDYNPVWRPDTWK